MTLGTVLLVILVLALLGVIPAGSANYRKS